MRVVIIGQAAFGEAVFRRLQENGVEVVGVSAPKPAEGARPDPLWVAAEGAGLELVPTSDLKNTAGIGAWTALRADLCVMAFVTDILPDEVFAAAKLGTIQYHPSLLPLHRGMSAMNWPLIFGAQETGLTVFWPDHGIDTGPILLQKRCAIDPDETLGSLYFDKLFPMGVEALAEAVEMVARGDAPRFDQNHSLATYEPPCTDKHAEIQWHQPAAQLYALIRGCNPQPGAWTMYEGQRLKVLDSTCSFEQEPGMPGKVLRIDEMGFDVRLNGGVLRVSRVQPEGGKKLGATEWARSVRLEEGYRFK
jgi:methionyl-tRNA formyltransferase